MGNNLNENLYLDMEWSREGRHSRIIQIGIVEVDTLLFEFKRKEMFYVKPEGKYKLNKGIQELTGIHPEDLEIKGLPFKSILNLLTKFKPTKRATFTWGEQDKVMLDKACQIEGLLNPFNLIDLSWMFSNFMGLTEKIKFSKALEMLGITPEGSSHDALFDSINLASLHLELIKRTRKGSNVER